MKKLIVVGMLATVFSVLANDGGCPVSEKARGHENIEWTVSYAFHLTDANKNLPRVLLVGDSICNAYQGRVRELTEGKCNISFWVSSYCVTCKEYLRLLEFKLDESKYDVVHFNNGLHSLGANPEVWSKALREAFKMIRRKQPQAKIVWVTSTPLKDPKLTAKARELNQVAAKVVKEFGDITTNDLFSLIDPLDREQNWSDVFHHKQAAREMEAKQVAETCIRCCLKK